MWDSVCEYYEKNRTTMVVWVIIFIIVLFSIVIKLVMPSLTTSGRLETIAYASKDNDAEAGMTGAVDGWGNNIRLDVISNKYSLTYRAVSSGGDGEFGTLDDIDYDVMTNFQSKKWVKDKVKNAIGITPEIPKVETIVETNSVDKSWTFKFKWGKDKIDE